MGIVGSVYVIPSVAEGCFASIHFHIPPKSPFAKGGLGYVIYTTDNEHIARRFFDYTSFRSE